MNIAERNAIFREKSDARAEVYAVCQRLRQRGDVDSANAAAMIEGTIDAYAALVERIQIQRERIKQLEDNLRSTDALWGRVPYEVRHAVAHRKTVKVICD